MVGKKEEKEDNHRDEEKKDQITLLWNAVIDLQKRIRKLERALEHK